MVEPAKPLILVVDDDASSLARIARHLKAGDFEVLESYDVETGLEKAAHLLPDLILLKAASPGMDGYEACRRLKNVDKTRDIPILLMTARTGKEFRAECFASGAADYVPLPVACEELLARVRVHLRVRALSDRLLEHRVQPEWDRSAMIRNSLAEAERARDKISAILKSVQHGIIVTDTDGRVVLMNPSAERLLGRAAEDLSDRPIVIGDIIAQESFLRHLKDSLAGKNPASPPELDLQDHASGEMRTFQVGISPVRSKEGTTTRAVIVLGDVTRERDIARMKNEFISTAAHELNTPLTAIMGYLELLMKQAELGSFSAEQQREFLSIIYRKSESLSRTVDELLQLSQLETGRRIRLHKSRFEIQKLISEAVEHFAGHSPHRLVMELHDKPISIVADRIKIFRVLKHLLSNAIKYSPDVFHPILVVFSIAEGECRISVEDKGIGIPRKQLEKIFETFYRVDASNTAVGGLGLGTSIAKKFVEAHGGRIWLESDPGKGTKANFTIPVA